VWRREAIQAENAFAAPSQVTGHRAAHRAQTDNDDIEPGRHLSFRESPRISANLMFCFDS
jgi:hypothetical protein